MSSYIGEYAGLYDAFYSEKDYAHEVEFIHSIINPNNQSKKLLELACGTGNHSFYFEKLKYEIDALDYSKDMIEQAKIKAKEQVSANRFHVADMRKLPFSDSSFDVVLCLFDSIGYVQDNESISQVIQEAKRVLTKGGEFICEFWHAGAMIKSYDALRTRELQFKGKKVLRVSETTMDIERQTCDVAYSIYIMDGSQVEVIKETQTNRFFLCQEMKLFLKEGGFSEVKFFDAYSKNPVNKDTWHVVAKCKV